MWTIFYLLFVALFLAPLFLICSTATWTATYQPNATEIHMESYATIKLALEGIEITDNNIKEFQLKSSDNGIAKVEKVISIQEINTQGVWNGDFNVSGIFLGKTEVSVVLHTENNQTEESNEKLSVTVIREERAIDHIFTGTVALLVSVLYINFGAALDLGVLKGILSRPIGPVIGFFGQFVVMPLLSYGIGHLIFPTAPELALGLFFTGVSPAGGASNIWTAILNGNIHLSITMTTISTFAAFGMMPLWIFTLGKEIFSRGNLGVPYSRIATFAIALVIPLGIGLLIQKYLPKISRILVKILKPFSTILIVFIIVFAIVTNLYLFELFSWQIVVAGLGLPWLGFILGWIIAKLLRQVPPDALAIGIETGIQNTGIAIFLLRFSLPQPEADLTTVIPVAVAIMTPLPLLALFIFQKIKERCIKPNDENRLMSKESSILTDSPDTLQA